MDPFTIGLSLWKWVSGSGVTLLTNLYDKYKDSQAASDGVKANIILQQLASAIQVRMAMLGFWEMRLLTFAVGFIMVTHLVLVGMDTCFDWTPNGHHIPKWPSPMDEWEASIILSFFGLQAGLTVVKAGLTAIMRR